MENEVENMNITIDRVAEPDSNTIQTTPNHNSNNNNNSNDAENINIELSDIEISVKIEPSNTFLDIKSTTSTEEERINEKKLNEDMPGCGTWFDECFNCCYIPSKCVSFCGYLLPITTLRQIYFFGLYLFTGELTKDAVRCMQCLKMKPASDDQINITETIITAVSIAFELYKTLIGSFLTVFTSQRCGSRTCTIWENIVPKNDLEYAGIVTNFLMATTLLIEYIFEIMREAYLIKYLKHDKSLANNGEHIAELYKIADKHIFEKLIPLYIIYIRFSYVVLLVYIVNVFLSAVIVSANYYDNTSIFSFVTNALFIIYKIYNVVEITSYRGNYFYSAYKKKYIHYNTIRPQYIIQSVNDQRVEQFMNDVELPLNKNENILEPIQPEHENIEITRVICNTKENIELPQFSINNIVDITQMPELCNNEHSKLPILCDGEGLSELEKEKVIHDLYEKKYIDKKVYRKLALYLRKLDIGGVVVDNI